MAGISGLFEINVSVLAGSEEEAIKKIKSKIREHTVVSVMDPDVILSCNFGDDIVRIGSISIIDTDTKSLYSNNVESRYTFINNNDSLNTDEFEEEIPTRPDTPISIHKINI